MTRLVRVVLVLGVVLAMSGAALAAPVATVDKGMGGVAWGGDPAKTKGFMKLKTLDGVDYFVNLRERLEVKGFAKPTVFYGAVDGRLYSVHLRLKEPEAYAKLKAQLAAVYGPGKQGREEGGPVTRWKTGKLWMKLKHDSDGQTKLSFYYQPVAVTLAISQRELEPSSDLNLLRQLPAEGAQAMVPAGAAPEKPAEPKEAIDLISVLKKGHN